VTLPKLSIAAKLYVIFALMAATTLALSTVAVHNARQHAALTQEFESANKGSLNVERVNGLIYAVQSAARGVVMSPDAKAAGPYLADLNKFNNAIDAVISDWQTSVRAEDTQYFHEFSIRISDFQNFAPELARIATESGPGEARGWAEKNFPTDTRNQLTRDLERLSRHYADRAAQTYAQMSDSIARTGLLLSVLAAFAVMLAVFGALIISRSVARPIGAITRVTEAVAATLGLAYGYAVGLAVGVLTTVVACGLVAWLLLGTSPVVRVDDRVLRAGRARLPLGYVGRRAVVSPADTTRLRGRDADPSAYLCVRSYVRASVMVEVTDPQDPHPYWLVSTRRPEALLAALDEATASASADR